MLPKLLQLRHYLFIKFCWFLWKFWLASGVALVLVVTVAMTVGVWMNNSAGDQYRSELDLILTLMWGSGAAFFLLVIPAFICGNCLDWEKHQKLYRAGKTYDQVRNRTWLEFTNDPLSYNEPIVQRQLESWAYDDYPDRHFGNAMGGFFVWAMTFGASSGLPSTSPWEKRDKFVKENMAVYRQKRIEASRRSR